MSEMTKLIKGVMMRNVKAKATKSSSSVKPCAPLVRRGCFNRLLRRNFDRLMIIWLFSSQELAEYQAI
jgi:hypothetical protein